MTNLIGKTGTYTSTKGIAKAAIVIGDQSNVSEGHSTPVPDETQVNIVVFGLNGNASTRTQVPVVSLAGDISDDYKDGDGNLVGVFTLDS